MKTIEEIRKTLESNTGRSAWSKGVTEYALDLLAILEQDIKNEWVSVDVLTSGELLDKALLDGANSWAEYSWGGCALIIDAYIARRLCTPSELKRTRNGSRKPNPTEYWLDTQARALSQAAERIKQIALAGEHKSM